MGKSYKKPIIKTGDRSNKKSFNRSLRRKMKQNVFGFSVGDNAEYKKENNSYDIYDTIFKMSKTKEELIEKRIKSALDRYEEDKKRYVRIMKRAENEPDIDRKWERNDDSWGETGDSWRYWKTHMTEEERYSKYNNKYITFFLDDWNKILFSHNMFIDIYEKIKFPEAPDLERIKKEAIREWKKRTSK